MQNPSNQGHDDVDRVLEGSTLDQALGEEYRPGARPQDPLKELAPRYQMIRFLGQGSRGAVYLARDHDIGRDVAIKCVRGRDESDKRRIREARLTGRVDHDNIVRVHDVCFGADGIYLVYEYIAGSGLNTVEKPMAWQEVQAIALDLARGLAAMHDQAILHRDIKPANAMREEKSGRVKLIDFSLAKQMRPDGHRPRPGTDDAAETQSGGWRLARGTGSSEWQSTTRPGARPGTPPYMAPEIWRGQPATKRSDIYSLGALLHELCTGRRPVAMDRPGRPGLRLELPDDGAGFAAVVNRCLELDAARRYPSATDLVTALEGLGARVPGRLHSRLGIALIVLALLAILAAAFALVPIGGPDDQRRDEIATRLAAGAALLRQSQEMVQGYETALGAFHDRLRRDEPELEVPWQDILRRQGGIADDLDRTIDTLDAALTLDSGRSDVRETLGRALHEAARFAVLIGRDHRPLVDRLGAMDQRLSARWTGPIPVAIRTEPAGGELAIWRYQPDDRGQLELQPYAPRQPGVREVLREWLGSGGGDLRGDSWLEPGSYLIIVQESDERIEVRHPLRVESRAIDADRVHRVELYRPEKSRIPEGFVYVPPGRFFYGHGRNRDHEAARDWHEAPPLHERDIAPFLVARHETTYAEWIEFVDACGDDRCPGIRAPAGLRSEENALLLGLDKNAAGQWQLTWRTTSDHPGYRVIAGQALAYEQRTIRSEQDWRRFPVAGVTLDHVRLYVRWLREAKGVVGARLCTQFEWERAARGADDRMFPHGDVLSADQAAIDTSHDRRPLAYGPDEVGSHPVSASPFGLHDMAGNLWEMTAPIDSGEVVPRGGSFYQPIVNSLVFSRWFAAPDQPLPYLGFRICAAAPVRD